MASLLSAFPEASTIFSSDWSVLLMQFLMMLGAFLVIFLVLFATRDIILRTNSFLYQTLCILLVAALPVVGFLIYLLIRPSRTLSQRRLERQVADLLSRLQGTKKEGKGGTGGKGGKDGKNHASTKP